MQIRESWLRSVCVGAPKACSECSGSPHLTVWRVVMDGRQHGDHEVHQCANNGRCKDNVRNGVVGVEGRDDEGCQEQENGGMKKAWNGLYGNGYIEAGSAIGKVGTDASALMNCNMRVRRIKVLVSPALWESCQQSAKEGYDKAQKPECVDQESRGWWLKTGLRGDRRFDRGTGSIQETVDIWVRSLTVSLADSGSKDL